MKVRNTFVVFLVSGFWHGANWNFIVWGLLNALYIMSSIIFNTNRANLDVLAQGRYLPRFKEFLSVMLTFALTVFAWIFFRYDNITAAFQYIHRMFTHSLISKPDIFPKKILLLIIGFVIVEWNFREKNYAIATVRVNWSKPL
jgi:alginate O-acetyltransferase complex protein AlgI